MPGLDYYTQFLNPITFMKIPMISIHKALERYRRGQRGNSVLRIRYQRLFREVG